MNTIIAFLALAPFTAAIIAPFSPTAALIVMTGWALFVADIYRVNRWATTGMK
jgi:hypothetical protein